MLLAEIVKNFEFILKIGGEDILFVIEFHKNFIEENVVGESGTSLPCHTLVLYTFIRYFHNLRQNNLWS